MKRDTVRLIALITVITFALTSVGLTVAMIIGK